MPGNAPGARGAGKWRPGRPGAAWTARCGLDGPSRRVLPGRPEPTVEAWTARGSRVRPGSRADGWRRVRPDWTGNTARADTARATKDAGRPGHCGHGGREDAPLVRATDAATRRLFRVFTAGECQCHSVLNRRRREGRWMESAD